MLIGTNSLLINPAIDQKLPYDTFRDLTGVSMIATQPVALVANKALPASTIPELVAEAKQARREPLNYTSPGPARRRASGRRDAEEYAPASP